MGRAAAARVPGAAAAAAAAASAARAWRKPHSTRNHEAWGGFLPANQDDQYDRRRGDSNRDGGTLAGAIRKLRRGVSKLG